jgi:phosphoribosyl-AMP cyclohydrolase
MRHHPLADLLNAFISARLAIAHMVEMGARVVPVVLQDADSAEVLFIGYANEETLQVSLRERIAVLWST